MPSDEELIEASLLAVAEAGTEIRHRLFERFFDAYPARREDFISPEATAIRMTDETLQMMLGLAKDENWVWPQVAELFYEHRGFGDPEISEYGVFIDLTVEEIVAAAGDGCEEACRAAWRRQAEELTAMIRKARDQWSAVMPG